jgi:putative tricarboxylic transport membrane protein
LGCEPAPMLLGYILGPLMEEYLRRALLMSYGDPMIFLTSPISAAMLGLAALALVLVVSPHIRKTRDTALKE